MKEHPVKLMNISDLIRFNSYVKRNHIKGKVVQKSFCTSASSLWGLAFALPLDSATLITDSDYKLA